MKKLLKLIAPPWLALGLGVPAMGFMILLMTTGLDDRNLFIPGHYAGILVWLLTAAMAVLLGLSLNRLGGRAKYNRMFPASTPAAIGILGAAAACLWSGWQILTDNAGPMEIVSGILGLLSAAALVYLAWCRFRGLRGSFLLWACAAVFLMLRLMFSYRIWSAQPELLRYCFPLLASVCVTLGFYYRTAFGVGLGDRRMYLLFTQMGAFLCLVTLGSGFDMFYAGMLLWCVGDLTNLRPMKTGRRERLPQEKKPEATP